MANLRISMSEPRWYQQLAVDETWAWMRKRSQENLLIAAPLLAKAIGLILVTLLENDDPESR